MDKVCLVCGKHFTVYGKRKDTAKYCSRKCSDIGQNKQITLRCEWCGKEVIFKPSKAKKSKHHFCSLKCLGLWNGEKRKNRVKKICEICGKEYEVKKCDSTTSVTCSTHCQNEWQRIHRIGANAANWQGGGGLLTCKQCGKQFMVRRYQFLKGSAKFCSQKCKQEYWKNNVLTRESFKKARHDGNMKMLSSKKPKYCRETSLEKSIRLYLEKNNIPHECQYVVNNKFCVDFYIPDSGVIIEALGDYWHANPLKYSESNMNKLQQKNKHRDKARFAYLKACGYVVFPIWEHDVNTNIDSAMQPFMEYIGTRTTDISGTSSEV